MSHRHIDTNEILELFKSDIEYEEIYPSFGYFKPEYYSQIDVEEVTDIYHGRYVKWDLSSCGYVIELPVKRIFVTNENMWYFAHAAAIYNHIEERDAILEHPPAGRVYRITRKDYMNSLKWHKSGELEDKLGMNKPWEPKDIGELYGYIQDGNHRFLAAVTAGETKIPFYVSENYHKIVEDEEWL